MKRRYEKYAWPGGYPMFYMNKHDEVICPDCANKDDEEHGIDLFPGINWEDPFLICDICGKRIKSAYAEEEVRS